MFNGTQLEYPYSAQVFETLFKRVMTELPKGLRELLRSSNDTNQKCLLIIKYIFDHRLSECTPELLRSIINSGELFGMDFGDGSKKSVEEYKRELFEYYLQYFFPGSYLSAADTRAFESLDRAYMNQVMILLKETNIETWEWVSESYLNALKNVGYSDQSDHFLTDNAERRAAQLDLYLTRYGELRSQFIEAFMDEDDMPQLLIIYAELRLCITGIIREIFDLNNKEAAKIVECIFGSGVILDIKEIGEFRMILSDNDLDFEIHESFVIDNEKDYGEVLRSIGYEWLEERELHATVDIATFLFNIDLNDDIDDNPSLQYMLDGEGYDFVSSTIAAAKRYTFFRIIRFTNSQGAVVNLCDDDYIYGGDDKSDDYDGEQ
jgi:hypothetical protein